MKKLSKIQMFEQEAEQLLGYGGDHKGFIGGDDGYAGEEYIGADSYAGGDGLDTIDEADRTITITISNSNTAGTANAILFGAFPFPTLTQASGITVNVLESSHDILREESKVNVMFFKGLKYKVSAEAQFDNNISLTEATASGATVTKSFQPLSYRSAQNQINTQIDAPNFAWKVAGRDYWTIPVNAGVTATLIMFIKTRSDQANVLKGHGVTTIARGKVPTGLPQLDR